MKIEIIFVFLLISSIFSTDPSFTASAIASGTCTSGSYTFKVNGVLSAATSTAISITPTFTSPSSPTVTCSLPATTEENLSTAAIECTITSVLNGDSIAISAMSGTGVTFAGLPLTMTGTATCGTAAPAVTFTASSIATGTCGNDGIFTFKVSGALSAATSSAISIKPTFTSPTKAPTVTCSLPVTAAANIASAAVECKVTSALSGDKITVSAMTGTGVTISGLPQTMTGTATCAGKSEEKKNEGSDGSDGSDDDAKFIQLSKFLMIILFTIF